jgi:hypothetical protein
VSRRGNVAPKLASGSALLLSAFAALSAAVVTLAPQPGCASGDYFIYEGRLYDPVRDCVAATTGIDLLAGEDPGKTCSPVCVQGADIFSADGGPQTIVSTMCTAPPPGFTASLSPECQRALDALQRGDECLADGKSKNPRDGGADSEIDATFDAPLPVTDASIPDAFSEAPDAIVDAAMVDASGTLDSAAATPDSAMDAAASTNADANADGARDP